MASLIGIGDAKAWVDSAGQHLTIASIDEDLSSALEAALLARLSNQYDVSTWTTAANTPALIKKVLGMQYVAWLYEKIFSSANDTSNYGTRLLAAAERIIVGLEGGTITLEVDPLPGVSSSPSFYPNNASSAQLPTAADPSLGGPVFALGQIW